MYLSTPVFFRRIPENVNALIIHFITARVHIYYGVFTLSETETETDS